MQIFKFLKSIFINTNKSVFQLNRKDLDMHKVISNKENMCSRPKHSLDNINYKLFFALLIMGLCPTIYNTLRIFWLGELPGEYSYSIAGQLSWVNLIYEIINEAIILPLFYFMGKVLLDKKEFTNRIKTGLLITLCVYLLLSSLVIVFTEPLLKIMATSKDIIDMSVDYIRLESIANIFSALASY